MSLRSDLPMQRWASEFMIPKVAIAKMDINLLKIALILWLVFDLPVSSKILATLLLVRM